MLNRSLKFLRFITSYLSKDLYMEVILKYHKKGRFFRVPVTLALLTPVTYCIYTKVDPQTHSNHSGPLHLVPL